MKLPRGVSGKRCVKALQRLGFEPHHQVGSHLVMRNSRTGKRISVPLHAELDTGTLLAVLRQADVTREEFLREL